MDERLLEEIELAGKHGVPSTGDGRKGHGPKPQKAQITQKTGDGTVLPKTTAKLWGIFSGKKGKS